MLVQDYHFALAAAPDQGGAARRARRRSSGTFRGRIPRRSASARGRRELLDGLLGADLIGFHTQAHCNNFLETVDRALESQIDWERFTARRHDHVTHVRPFPISVASPEPRPTSCAARSTAARRASAPASSSGVTGRLARRRRRSHRLHEGHRRALPRHRALLREVDADYVGQFTFVQIAAPSRTRIPRYQDLLDEVTAEADTHQPAVRDGQLEADRAAHAASRPRGDRAVLPRGRRVPRHVAARRHEPGRQGVRGRARRRGRRADSEPVRGRERASCATRSSSIRTTPSSSPTRSAAALEMPIRRAPRPHGAHAPHRARAQRLSLGGRADRRPRGHPSGGHGHAVPPRRARRPPRRCRTTSAVRSAPSDSDQEQITT